MTDDSTDMSPHDAFALLGHDLRVDILLALSDAEGRSLPFTELRQRVDGRDSGKFNYHLSKLVDRFIAHDEDDDVYRLLYPGHRVIDAIENGVFHEQATVEDVTLDRTCHDCGSQLRFDYDTINAGRVSCPDCDRLLIGFPFDPGGLTDRDAQSVVTAFDRRTRNMWERARADVCPVCSGHVDAAFVDGSVDEAATHGLPALIDFDCMQCSFFCHVPPGAVLVTHPGVVAFLAENGIDARERRLWELPFVVDPAAISVDGTDPWDVSITVEAGGEERTAVFGDPVTVTSFD
jgi:uncharacterized protein (UPF0212 family)